jgi:prepilin-type processing-associated H-X9-DG protein
MNGDATQLRSVITSGKYAFRSSHAGGCNFLYADGAVKFHSESIDMGVYRGLGSRNGGEVVNLQ